MNGQAQSNLDVAALGNWFGRDGAVLPTVAQQLSGCSWIGVPFAGGMGALSQLKCNQGVATDLHHHIVNLASVAVDSVLREQFMDALELVPCNHETYRAAQLRCLEREREQAAHVVTSVDLFGTSAKPAAFAAPMQPDVVWAVNYFIVSWMGRGGNAGQGTEFTSDGFSVRWKATGGSSSSRWRSALRSFPLIGEVLKRWTFVCMDAFAFLDQAFKVEQASEKKTPGVLRNGLYLDPPFPTVGEPYTHNFTTRQQRDLADSVSRFRATKVVMRFHDDPLIRELYPQSVWTWIELKSRAQDNTARAEVLLVNRNAVERKAVA